MRVQRFKSGKRCTQNVHKDAGRPTGRTALTDPLIERCVKGDQIAWGDFIHLYTPVITHAITGVLKGHVLPPGIELEDIRQEVLVRLLKNDYHLLRLFDRTRSTFSTYLSRVAASTTLDAIRRPRLRTRSIEECPCVQHSQMAVADPLELPLCTLSPREREVVDLILKDGLTVTEVAEKLGTTTNNVRVIKHNAIKRLRGNLPRSGPD